MLAEEARLGVCEKHCKVSKQNSKATSSKGPLQEVGVDPAGMVSRHSGKENVTRFWPDIIESTIPLTSRALNTRPLSRKVWRGRLGSGPTRRRYQNLRPTTGQQPSETQERWQAGATVSGRHRASQRQLLTWMQCASVPHAQKGHPNLFPELRVGKHSPDRRGQGNPIPQQEGARLPQTRTTRRAEERDLRRSVLCAR